MPNEITPQEREDYGEDFLNVVGKQARATVGGQIASLQEGTRPSGDAMRATYARRDTSPPWLGPRKPRPRPRRPGWQGALQAMDAEDRLVRELYEPGAPTSAQQAAAAVELAERYVTSWYDALPPIRNVPIYRPRKADTAWVEAAKLAVDGKPDPEIVERLDRQLAKLPVDMAAVAALNAARWIIRRYEISKRLH
jgi:hypothetical protein